MPARDVTAEAASSVVSGVVAFITGLPSSGKSTFADSAFAALRERGVPSCLLDDNAPAERADFYETLANLAALVAEQGLVVLVVVTAESREFRDKARALAPAFVEVWLDTPADECARRNKKGRDAAATSARARDVLGADAPYEPPLTPDVRATGGHDTAAIEALVARVLRAAPELV